ncbi:hypothetical protein VHN57_20390 [Sphingobium sp. WW5]|uniref:hypothetical protein n=1 Tax=unclassified Sphingobium TaxID=2611147 RepID=UPI003C2414CA
MKSIAPVSGWMLDRIALLDQAKPGFAGHYLRASDERRQVTAAFFAVVELGVAALNEAAEFLMDADHRSILRRAFGIAPRGLRAALGRSGSQPHEPAYYRQLFDLLSKGTRHLVEATWRSAILNPDRLAIITGCPVDLCDARILDKMKDHKHATDVALSVDLLSRRGVDRPTLVEALRRADSINDAIKRWSMQMAFPPGPIPAANGYRPIRSGVELAEIARKYRNCSRGYFSSAMAGGHAFGEFRYEGEEVLISFDKTDGMWIVDGVYGYRNLSVDVSVSRAAYAFAARFGVPDRRPDRSDKAVEALRRLGRFHGDWGL